MYQNFCVPEYYIMEHSGIKGMKWGVRRYQNSDGSLTPVGKARYAKLMTKFDNKMAKRNAKMSKAIDRINDKTGGYSYTNSRHNASVNKQLRKSAKKAIFTGSRTAHQLAKMDQKTGLNLAAKKYGKENITGSDYRYRIMRSTLAGSLPGKGIATIANRGKRSAYEDLIKSYAGSGGPTSINMDVSRYNAYRNLGARR